MQNPSLPSVEQATKMLEVDEIVIPNEEQGDEVVKPGDV